MRTLYTLTFSLLALLILSACKGKKEDDPTKDYSTQRLHDENEAAKCLTTARHRLAADSVEGARQVIERMRQDFPLAITARRHGILLMDSIDLRAAQIELAHIDSLMRTGNADTLAMGSFDEACRKVQFYERKIQHDAKNLPR